MEKEYSATQLADRAAKVLLLFLLARSETVSYRTHGLGGARSSQFYARALADLLEAGIVGIVPQDGGPCQVHLSSPFCGILPTVDTTALSNQPNIEPPDLLELCRQADKANDRKQQIEALQRVWDEVFPQEEYPFQRLVESAAKKFLANGRASEQVAQVIMDARTHAKERIQSPRAYVEAALSRADAKSKRSEQTTPTDEVVIDDNLRELVKIGRKQFNGQGG